MALAASPVFVRDVEMAESELGQSYEALGERENALGAYHRAYVEGKREPSVGNHASDKCFGRRRSEMRVGAENRFSFGGSRNGE